MKRALYEELARLTEEGRRICRMVADKEPECAAAEEMGVKRTTMRDHKKLILGIRFHYKSGMLFITLPSGRRLSYVKPRIGENRFGGESVTYEGMGVTGRWMTWWRACGSVLISPPSSWMRTG